MNILQAQYDEELKSQEIKSNKCTIQGFLVIFTLQAVVWLLVMIDFFEIDKLTISLTLGITGALVVPLVIFMRKGDLSNKRLKYFLLLLVCFVSSMLVSALTIHAYLLSILPLLFAVQYRDTHALWYTFGVNTVAVLLSSYLGFYYGLCDLNILLESTHKYKWYMDNLTEVNGVQALVLPFNENPTFIIGVFQVFPITIIVLAFTIMLQYTIISNYNDAMRIAELTYKKDTDIRTKVFNKTKYEEMAENYYPNLECVAVAFWDLNNLKYINDNFGHAMGDALIDAFSSSLNESSSEKCRIYRVGGDEFLMIIDNPVENEIEQEVENIKQRLLKSHESGGMKVSAAVGFDVGTGANIRKTVSSADEKMYQNKILEKQAQ